MRVLQCRENIAGQAWEYAEGLRSIGIKSKCLIFRDNNYQYDEYIPIDKYKHGRSIRLWINLFRCIKNYDVFHFHTGNSLLPANNDLSLLKKLGKKIVMNYWGSDVRRLSVAKSKNKYVLIELDENEIIEKMKKISKYVDVVIVPDYELYENVEGFFNRIEIVRATVNLDSLKMKIPEINKSKTTIVHAPSQRNIKGTEHILNAIKQLEKEGYNLDLIIVEKVSHREALQICEESDIIIDQLLIGSHGIFAIEAMAMGKPVICYIRDDLISKYPQELPIVSANPDNIYNKLKMLIDNPKLIVELGGKGRKYAEMYHDSRKIAQQLLTLYKSLL